MQINLTGFLNGKNARLFMAALWEHLLSAMENEMGVPEAFIAAKKAEIQAREVSIFHWLVSSRQTPNQADLCQVKKKQLSLSKTQEMLSGFELTIFMLDQNNLTLILCQLCFEHN